MLTHYAIDISINSEIFQHAVGQHWRNNGCHIETKAQQI